MNKVEEEAVKTIRDGKIMKNNITIIITAIMLCFVLTGCTEAEEVNQQLSNSADYFECERRITVYNVRTDTIILQLEGYFSLSNNSTDDLVVTCKTGKSEYKKNDIYLNDYTVYVVEDITGTDADPYHYKFYFHTKILPDIEFEP